MHLFRRFLYKPCLIIMPIWLLFWSLDCLQLMLRHVVIPPYVFLAVCHAALPAVIAWYLMQMQAEDEQLVLSQRKERVDAETGASIAVAVEDPSPTYLKELLTCNPVVITAIGVCAALPIVISSLVTPLTTVRGKLAQSYVYLMFGPLVLLQVIFVGGLILIEFTDLPSMYLTSFTLLFRLPPLVIWCICVCFTWRYSYKDVVLVKKQRQERAKEVVRSEPGGVPEGAVVDCAESHLREYELTYSA